MAKRIICTVTNDLTYDRRMHRICATLQDAGYEVTLVGRKLRDSDPIVMRSFRQQRLRCLFYRGPLFYLEYQMRLFWYLLFARTDLIYACDLDTALPVVFAGGIKGRRKIFDAHEYFTEVPEVERRSFVKRIWHNIGLYCIPRFDVRLTVGEELAKELERVYQVPFGVVRNVPEARHGAMRPATARTQTIVYLGTLNEGRGLEHLISAMNKLPDYHLLLIGEGDLSEELRNAAQDSGAGDRIEFASWVKPERLHELLSTAMVGVNVLEARSASYYYSLANKFFDYIHAGLPSVNMNFPEYRKIMKQYPVGICIETLSADAIAKAIKEILSDGRGYEAMIGQCDRAARVFNWEHEKEVLVQMIAAASGST